MTAARLELRVPPVAVVLLTALIMWLLARVAPGAHVPLPHTGTISWVVALAAAVLCTAGIIEVRRARTTINPMTPEAASALVTRGVYRLTRNPMYLAFALALAAWAIFLSNALPFVVLPGFIAYMNRFQIVPEERALRERFGEAFSGYAAAVRRWV